MEINFFGQSSFKIKGKTATIVCDPFDSGMIGIKFPKVEADIVTVSHDHPDHNAVSNVLGNPYVIFGPGEYEIKGVSILGVSVFHDDKGGIERGKSIMYQINIDGLTVLHLGDLGHKLTSKQVETVGSCDILMVPVGGYYTIDASTASEVAAQFEPKIIIPMHYCMKGMSEKIGVNLDGVDKFLKEMGKEGVVSTSRLLVTKDKLPEETEVVVLQ